jgi:hypothetical protein
LFARVSKAATRGPRGAVRQFGDEATDADSDLAEATLVNRRLARALAGETVDVCRRSDHEQVEALQRRDGVVDRHEVDLAVLLQRQRDPLRDVLRVSEPRLVDDERSHRTPPVLVSSHVRVVRAVSHRCEH